MTRETALLLALFSGCGPEAAADPRVLEIPGGSFEMGSGAHADATPHPVRLSPFRMDAEEVTDDAFRHYASGAGLSFPEQPEPSCGRCPVVNVTWEEARGYCRSLGKDLPTEAQWERAARGDDGRGHTYPWGDRWADLANVDGVGPVPVGSFPPNDLGLFDVIGNAAEWVLDWYHPDTYRIHAPTDPRGPDQGTDKVVRGGGWYHCANRATSANRFAVNPDKRHPGIGFRCAQTLDGTSVPNQEEQRP